ncbi:MAG TPA: DUF2062 domain-containing protein [Labilithrix sp.]|nr:DUF2062 domain-containing protein [Labilithrix sp.]
MFRRLWEAIKRLWKLAKSERASPREIGWAVALGAFIGCTPAVGLRPWIAVGVATLVRKNRLFAYLGSHTSNIVFMPFITVAEVQLSHRLRTGTWVDIDRKHITEQAPTLLLDWCLGTLPVGVVVALALGFLGYGLALRRDARAARIAAGLTAERAAPAAPAATPTPPPTGAPPPSSGSRA